MQHFFIYSKWNERLFKEVYFGYLSGRLQKNPTEGWYQGELWFFDNYVIPLAKKLKDCAVFGHSSDEYYNYAVQNRTEWERKGRTLCEVMKKKADKEAMDLGLIRRLEEAIAENAFPGYESDTVSLGDTTIDTTQGASLDSDFNDIPQEVQAAIEARIAEEVRMALEDSELPTTTRRRGASEDSSRGHSVRSVKVPPGRLGLVVDASEEGPVVQEVHLTSPVKGRIYPGDRIVGINGTSVEGLPQTDLAILMASQTDKEREFQIESL